ncbi:hypothetical protein ACFE04_017964 [Oxalis oulophora]
MANLINFSHDDQFEDQFDLADALSFPLELLTSYVTKPNSTSVSAELLIVDCNTTSDDQLCSVCVEGFEKTEDAKMVACGHIYHKDCIVTWFSNSDSCPLCRCKISADGQPLVVYS